MCRIKAQFHFLPGKERICRIIAIFRYQTNPDQAKILTCLFKYLNQHQVT